MKKSDIVLGVGAVLVGALVVTYLQQPRQESEPANTHPAAMEEGSVADQPVEPAIRYPVTPPEPEPEPEAAGAEPDAAEQEPPAQPEQQSAQAEDTVVQPPALPALDSSDPELRAALSRVVATQSLELLFNVDAVVRRLVVTVDNLPGKQFPRSQYRLAQSTDGLLVVRREGSGDDERLYLSPDNFARYTPFVDFVTTLDSDRLVSLYRHYYPLFQQAYEELGYPASAYFNDRLVDVIDHLLAAPVVDRPVRLVRPHVLYRYADAELEGLSAGQKVLVRMGPRNAQTLKAKLREVRGLLIAAG